MRRSRAIGGATSQIRWWCARRTNHGRPRGASCDDAALHGEPDRPTGIDSDWIDPGGRYRGRGNSGVRISGDLHGFHLAGEFLDAKVTDASTSRCAGRLSVCAWRFRRDRELVRLRGADGERRTVRPQCADRGKSHAALRHDRARLPPRLRRRADQRSRPVHKGSRHRLVHSGGKGDRAPCDWRRAGVAHRARKGA